MRIKTNTSRFLACLLLCSLFFVGYSNFAVFPSIGLINQGSDTSNTSSNDIDGQHSAMNRGVNAGFDFIEASDSLTTLNLFRAEQIRYLRLKNDSSLNKLPVPLVACLNYFTKLPNVLSTELDSRKIIILLHKKDGMK